MSGSLNCSAGNCVHNINGLCSANTIHVGGVNAHTTSGTLCDTFSSKGFVNAVSSLPNMNVTGEIKQLFKGDDEIVMSPRIKCDAENCMHNANRMCSASNVQVYGPGAETVEGTQCETFKE